jgi:hypothetical protein
MRFPDANSILGMAIPRNVLEYPSRRRPLLTTCILDLFAQMTPFQLAPMPRSIEILSYRRYPLLLRAHVGDAAVVVGSAQCTVSIGGRN